MLQEIKGILMIYQVLKYSQFDLININMAISQNFIKLFVEENEIFPFVEILEISYFFLFLAVYIRRFREFLLLLLMFLFFPAGI